MTVVVVHPAAMGGAAGPVIRQGEGADRAVCAVRAREAWARSTGLGDGPAWWSITRRGHLSRRISMTAGDPDSYVDRFEPDVRPGLLGGRSTITST